MWKWLRSLFAAPCEHDWIVTERIYLEGYDYGPSDFEFPGIYEVIYCPKCTASRSNQYRAHPLLVRGDPREDFDNLQREHPVGGPWQGEE